LDVAIRVAALVVAVSVHGFAMAAESAKSESQKSGPASQPAKSETAKADANRKKPLQRCDELADKAQLECLRKAREKIAELRRQREASDDKGGRPNAAKGDDGGKSGTANGAAAGK
jgi:hypothetical protein